MIYEKQFKRCNLFSVSQSAWLKLTCRKGGSMQVNGRDWGGGGWNTDNLQEFALLSGKQIIVQVFVFQCLVANRWKWFKTNQRLKKIGKNAVFWQNNVWPSNLQIIIVNVMYLKTGDILYIKQQIKFKIERRLFLFTHSHFRWVGYVEIS